MAEFVFEVLVMVVVQCIGRSLLWGLYAGRRPWSEFNEYAADVAGILFWVLLFGGIVIAVRVFG
jgi:hypothetical protein